MIIPKNDNAFALMVEYLFDFDVKTMSNNVWCVCVCNVGTRLKSRTTSNNRYLGSEVRMTIAK